MNLKKTRADLQDRVDYLKKQTDVGVNFLNYKFLAFLFFLMYLSLCASVFLYVRAMMTRGRSLMLLYGMMEKCGGWLLTHTVLRATLGVGNLLILFP